MRCRRKSPTGAAASANCACACAAPTLRCATCACAPPALRNNLVHGAASALEASRGQLGAMAGRLDALSPLKVLDRGYAVVINQSNSRAVLDAATVKFDDELDIRLAKGRLSARATGRSL